MPKVSLRLYFKILFVLSLGLNSSFASALTSTKSEYSAQTTSSDTFRYDHYFVIQEEELKDNGAESGSKLVKLYQFNEVNNDLPYPTEKYNRTLHFGTWIRPDSKTCLNTRGLVLKRESSIETQNSSNCTIRTGQWHDPYTDESFTEASQIQIDHLVPLKNAYMTGGFEWDNKKRCLYANFLGNRFHLLPVSGLQNEDKGDRSPAEYMPPNSNYQCQYLRNWLSIKLIWSLRLTPIEVDGIKKEIARNNCPSQDLTISVAEIRNQRKYIQDNANLCR